MHLETGEIFSQGFPLTQTTLGPRGVYNGKVVLIVDALCYSTTDFFAAGMQDNGLATIIGVDPVTGAGGGNVWNHDLLQQFAAQAGGPTVRFPRNIEIDVAIRRSIRVGPNEGLPVEGLGVFADVPYQMTARDVLSNNEDLINFSTQVLASQR
jgi:C-terminal processing protease CtpA/Prc